METAARMHTLARELDVGHVYTILRHRGSEREHMTIRVHIVVRGLVQGVGFRPYVFSLARQRGLRGQVCNTTTGVRIDVEGDDDTIEQFINELHADPPP